MSSKLQKRFVTARLPVRPETHQRIRDFSVGAGMTMDEAVDYLLRIVSVEGEEFETGRGVKDGNRHAPPAKAIE
jgi:hypothetical protein